MGSGVESNGRTWSQRLEVRSGENSRREIEKTRLQQKETTDGLVTQSSRLQESMLQSETTDHDAKTQEACESHNQFAHPRITPLHILDLPDEILLHIFDVLGWTEDARKWYFPRRASIIVSGQPEA